MRSLRGRFILSHLLPILLVVPLITILLLYLLETQVLLAEMSENITEKANLIADVVNGRPELLQNTTQAESFIAGVSISVDEGVILLSPQGVVIAATEKVPGEPLAETVDLSGLETAVSGDRSLVITYGLTAQDAIVLVPVRDINQQLIGIVGVTDTLAGAASQISRLRTPRSGQFAAGAPAWHHHRHDHGPPPGQTHPPHRRLRGRHRRRSSY